MKGRGGRGGQREGESRDWEGGEDGDWKRNRDEEGSVKKNDEEVRRKQNG